MPNHSYKPKTTCGILRRKFLKHPTGKGFTQKDIASDLRISESRWKQLELNQQPLSEKNALKLQEIYGVSAKWLLKKDLKARPITPTGAPFSPAIAHNSRVRFFMSSSEEGVPLAKDEWKLAGAVFGLLSQIRIVIHKARWDDLDELSSSERLTRASSRYLELRDAVLPVLKKYGVSDLDLVNAINATPVPDSISYDSIRDQLDSGDSII